MAQAARLTASCFVLARGTSLLWMHNMAVVDSVAMAEFRSPKWPAGERAGSTPPSIRPRFRTCRTFIMGQYVGSKFEHPLAHCSGDKYATSIRSYQTDSMTELVRMHWAVLQYQPYLDLGWLRRFEL